MGQVKVSVKVLECDLCTARDELTTYQLTAPRRVKVDLCPEHAGTPIREVMNIAPKTLRRRFEDSMVDDPSQIPREA